MIKPVDKEDFMRAMEYSSTVGDYSESAVERFYRWMYTETGGIIQVCAFPVPTEDQDVSEMGQGKWIHATSRAEFKDFCETHSGLWRYHVYSGVNTLDTRPSNGRGSMENIDRVNHLSLDIETDRKPYAGSTKEEVWWSYQYGLAQVKYISEEYGVWPLVVMSENGIHLHYKVDFPVKDSLLNGKQHLYTKKITQNALNSEYVEHIEQKSPDHLSFNQDDVSDVPRVMKVPGTLGIKSKDGRMCGIIHEPNKEEAGVITESDVDVDEVDIQRMCQKEQNKSKEQSVKIPKEDIDKGNLAQETINKVKRIARTDEVFRIYWEGKSDQYDSRSEAEFAFILKLLNHGFTKEQVVNIMWQSGMSKWNEDSDNYRRKTLENALDYFDGMVVKDSTESSLDFPEK